MQHTKYLIFKSVRGLARPWLVILPSQRSNPSELLWARGYATWDEAIRQVYGGKQC